MQIVLGRILSIRLPFVTIGFSFLPTTIAAIYYGKWHAAAVATVADFLGAILFPLGSFFIGYTITAFVSGFIRGSAFYKKDLTLFRVFIAISINQIITSLFLNTLWMVINNDGRNFFAIISSRLLGVLINGAIQIALTTSLNKGVLKKTIFKK